MLSGLVLLEAPTIFPGIFLLNPETEKTIVKEERRKGNSDLINETESGSRMREMGREMERRDKVMHAWPMVTYSWMDRSRDNAIYLLHVIAQNNTQLPNHHICLRAYNDDTVLVYHRQTTTYLFNISRPDCFLSKFPLFPRCGIPK
jgi:hypothetical protein